MKPSHIFWFSLVTFFLIISHITWGYFYGYSMKNDIPDIVQVIAVLTIPISSIYIVILFFGSIILLNEWLTKIDKEYEERRKKK